MELADSKRGVVSEVDALARRAKEIARKHGSIIGETSRYQALRVGGGGEIEIIVEPDMYFSHKDALRLEGLLAVADIKSGRLILLKIRSIERADELAMLGVQPPLSGYSSQPNPTGILTITRVRAVPFLEADLERGEDPAPATTAIEPQSPVIDPLPETISRLLGLPSDGVLLGALSLPSGLVKGGEVAVRLPYSAILHHVLIVGTTGSGKTTLLKNMVASLYSEGSLAAPIVVLVDMNQDFIQLSMEGRPSQAEVLPIHKGVRPTAGALIVLPVPSSVIRERWASGRQKDAGEALKEAFRSVARSYYERAIRPLLGDRGVPHEPSIKCRLDASEAMKQPTLCDIELGSSRFIIVPFVINTLASSDDHVASLMPDLSALGRDLLSFIRDEFKKKFNKVLAPPLPVIAAALRVYESVQRARRRGQGDNLDIEELAEGEARWIATRAVVDEVEREHELADLDDHLSSLVAKCYEALEGASPHEQTVMALHRRLLSLISTDIVDVMVGARGSMYVVPEPSWSLITREAERLRVPIIIDLKWPMDMGMGSLEEPRLVAYRLLKTLVAWKNDMWARRQRMRDVMVVIDEAHQFFPQEGASREEQEATRQVASMISAIARLGRSRGVGLVFSTHSPKDLHNIILQLVNTKIILRAEPQHLERLSVPEDALRIVPYLPNRTALVVGHSFRGGYLYVKTSPPLVAHFDVSYKPNYM